MTSLNEFTVRPDRGSDPLRFVRWRGKRQDYISSKSLIIFIHGFNNPEKTAKDNYQKFVEKLAGSPGDDPVPGYAGKLPVSLWAFYWPGDHPSFLVRKTRPFRVYTMRRGNAVISGQSLGELIMNLSPEQEVVLVAHSMGCRVLLEALAYWATQRQYRNGARIVSACLMAAAVSATECEGPEKYYRLRPGEPNELVLYSSSDGVLQTGFRIGEWLYNSKEGPAVGATGLPGRDRWTAGSVDTELGHTVYWKDRRSAGLVGDFLAGIPIDESASRAGPEERAREQPSRNEVTRDVATPRAPGDGDLLEWQNCFPPP